MEGKEGKAVSRTLLAALPCCCSSPSTLPPLLLFYLFLYLVPNLTPDSSVCLSVYVVYLT